MKKPLVLITNDDGVLAPGIRAIADALRDFADVVIAAPDRERSAASHSISLDRPLRYFLAKRHEGPEPWNRGAWKVNSGT